MVQRMHSSQKKGIKFDPESKEGQNLKASIMRSLTKRQRVMNDLKQSVKIKPKKTQNPQEEKL